MGKKVEKKPTRLGKDPFKEVDWIGKKEDESKSSTQNKSSTQSKQDNLSTQSKSKLTTTPDSESSQAKGSSAVSTQAIDKSEAISTSESPQEKPSSKAGLKKGWIRGTYILQEKWAETIKDYAYWERLDIKEVMDLALETFFKDKKVKPRSKKT